MPGTVRLELYSMPLADALSILMADMDASFGMSVADADELRHAARVVVQQHAADVALHYTSEPGEHGVLRVVNGGVQDDV